MPRIGLRQLKTHVSEVVKDVQENQARYTITNRGEPVALLVPYAREQEQVPEDPAEAWADFARLLAEAGKTAQSSESTEDLMRWLRVS